MNLWLWYIFAYHYQSSQLIDKLQGHELKCKEIDKYRCLFLFSKLKTNKIWNKKNKPEYSQHFFQDLLLLFGLNFASVFDGICKVIRLIQNRLLIKSIPKCRSTPN